MSPGKPDQLASEEGRGESLAGILLPHGQAGICWSREWKVHGSFFQSSGLNIEDVYQISEEIQDAREIKGLS